VLYLLLTGAREAMAATQEQLQSIPAGKQRRVGR
jgi:hypothetical protein